MPPPTSGDRKRYGQLPGTEEIGPLIRMAVGNYQFEATHPFTDGNGRMGRALNLLLLLEQPLLDTPVQYTSRHILRNRAEYYRGLQSVTATGAWEPWLLYMLHDVTETASRAMNKLFAIRAFLESIAKQTRTEAASIYSRELGERIFVRPHCRIAHLVEAGLAKRQSASVYLSSNRAISASCKSARSVAKRSL